MKTPEPKKIKIVTVKDDGLYELAIFRKVIRSRVGAYLVKLKPQEFEGVKIPKTEIWFPASSFIDMEFSSEPRIVVSGKFINPFLRSIQIQILCAQKYTS